jgi:hypothetical protein
MLELLAIIDIFLVVHDGPRCWQQPLSFLPCPAIVSTMMKNICPTLASHWMTAFTNATNMIDHLRQAPPDWRVREEVHCHSRCRGSPSDLHYRMLCPAEPRFDCVAMIPSSFMTAD